MNANVAQLLLLLAGGIGGIAAVQARFRWTRRTAQNRRSFELGASTLHPHV